MNTSSVGTRERTSKGRQKPFNSLDPYAVASMWIRDNTTILSELEVKLLLGWVRSRSLNKIASCVSNPDCNKDNLERFRFYMQLEAFFKKNALFTVKEVALSAARQSFERGEKLCRITNKRLDHFYSKRDRIDPDLRLVIERAECFIQRVLGDFKPFLGEIPDLIRITSGATASLPRRLSLPPLKVKRTTEMNPGTFPYFQAICKYYDYIAKARLVTCNRVEFVPKNWKTDRGIACEPTGSLPFQLAFDTYCKNRLRAVGVDLSTQFRNQVAAREGSISGLTATIDLSMASDTLAFNTVAWLIPGPWFEYLCAHRSLQYRLNGSIGTYAKFSSMGNGATFALETLVFLALARSCGDAKSIVYGDDIIISSECAPLLFRALKFFGFIPNVDKSFVTGPFRESCGGNYYEGTDITPFFLREDAGTDLCILSHNLNGLQRIASPYGELIGYVHDMVLANKLPLVPSNDDTLSGFHVHPHVAYRLNLIRTESKQFGPYVHCYKGLQYSQVTTTIRDARAAFIWHFRAKAREPEKKLSAHFLTRNGWNSWDPSQRGTYEAHAEPLVSSQYSLPNGKFRRRWKRWVLPTDFGAWGCIFLHSQRLSDAISDNR